MPLIQTLSTAFRNWYQRTTDLDDERHRLASFRVGWTNPHVNVKDLAAAGFFYLGTTRAENTASDLVECHFCGGKLYDWKAGDVPWFEHAKYFWRCPLMTGCMTKNIPITSTEELNAYLKTVDHVAVITSDLKVQPVCDYLVRRSRPLAFITKDSTVTFLHGEAGDV